MKDPIERQDAIDALADYIHNVDKVIGTGHLSAGDCKDAATSVLEDVPSAQSEADCFKCIFRGSPGFKQFQTKTEERTAETAQNVSDSDLISRKAAIDAVTNEMCSGYDCEVIEALERLPSAQPELPKQFMSDDCISRSELYKKVCEAEKLARERFLDTLSDSQFPNKLNPAYTRYSAQLDERTKFKHMIADARSVQPDLIRCKDCAKHEYCRTSTVWAVPPKDDWYCADAERRTDG